eukprot:403352402
MKSQSTVQSRKGSALKQKSRQTSLIKSKSKVTKLQNTTSLIQSQKQNLKDSQNLQFINNNCKDDESQTEFLVTARITNLEGGATNDERFNNLGATGEVNGLYNQDTFDLRTTVDQRVMQFESNLNTNKMANILNAINTLNIDSNSQQNLHINKFLNSQNLQDGSTTQIMYQTQEEQREDRQTALISEFKEAKDMISQNNCEQQNVPQNRTHAFFASTLRQEIQSLLQQAQHQQENSQLDQSSFNHQQADGSNSSRGMITQNSLEQRKQSKFQFPDENQGNSGKLGCLLMMRKTNNSNLGTNTQTSQFQSTQKLGNKFNSNQLREGSIMASTAPQTSNHNSGGNQRYNMNKNDFFLILDEHNQTLDKEIKNLTDRDERLSQISELICDPINLQNQTCFSNDMEGSSIIQIIENAPADQTIDAMQELQQSTQLQPRILQLSNQYLNETTTTAMSVMLDYGGNQSVRAQKVYQTRGHKGITNMTMESKETLQTNRKPHCSSQKENIFIQSNHQNQIKHNLKSEIHEYNIKPYQLQFMNGDQPSCDLTNTTFMNSPAANLGFKLQQFSKSIGPGAGFIQKNSIPINGKSSIGVMKQLTTYR